MKKLCAGLLALSMLTLNALPVLAVSKISDVSDNYWAKNEIYNVVDNSIMSLGVCKSNNAADKFCPEEPMTRAGFVKDLLKLLTNDNLEVSIDKKFSDVPESSEDYSNILRSQQLGLVYGYPDGTFKPAHTMSRAEAQSVMSHITRERITDTSMLSNYRDAYKIPAWAKYAYAKTLTYEIYANYPNADELRPNDKLTRAEAAVLLSRLKDRISLLKEEYIGPGLERVLAVEHLDVSKKAPSNEVKITNMRKIVTEGNVLAIAFESKFKSKEHKAGEVIHFVNNQAIYTREGTLLFPENSKFIASVNEVRKPKWFNRNARVYLQLTQVDFPDGTVIPVTAKPFYKDYALKEGPWMTAGKVALWTVGLGAIATGAGIGFAFIPDPSKIGNAFAIGTPIGLSVGFVTGLVTPGLNYSAKEGEQILVILLDDASLPKN